MKNRKNVIRALLLFVCVCLLGVLPAFGANAGTTAAKTGLKKEAGKYYFYNKKGEKVKNTWKNIKVKGTTYRYYFGKNGAAYAGKNEYGEKIPAIKTIGGKKYAFDTAAHMLKGARVIRGKFYVFAGTNGRLNTAKTNAVRKAARYGKDVTPVLKLLKKYGIRPVKTKYFTDSCYGNGVDGEIIFKNFKITVFKPLNKAQKVQFMGFETR